MRDLYALLFAFVLVAIPVVYLVWLSKADRARLAKGSTPFARFTSPETNVKAVATQLHEAIRADSFARLGSEDADLATRRARILELAREGLVVSPGVATPPGPVRVLLEVREAGDKPGMRAVALVRRDGSDKHRFEVELRGDRPRLFGVPRRESALFQDALARGLSTMPGASALEWSPDGERWSLESAMPSA